MAISANQLRISVLRSAISHMRCVLSEPWQGVESRRVAKANIAKYRAEIEKLEQMA